MTRIDERPAVLLLGTGHWSNPNLDFHATDYDDMLAPARQREIAACLDNLARFRPTKVAIETMADATDELNETYQHYRSGQLELTANERDQVGFRLAAMLGHERIYGIDWHDRHRDIGWDTAIAFAQTHGQSELVAGFLPAESEPENSDASQRSGRAARSVRELLLGSSDPSWMAADQRIYMDLARVGEGGDYIGADVVLRWYERNMKIFVNLTRLATVPDDRVVVLIGAGHLALLTHFIQGAGRFRLVPAADYLT